jgi:DNA-binding FadR family transcriptional regulator
MLRPVHRLSVSDAVFQQLRDAILAGDFRAGQALPGERTLSETLGVNRGAIREALKRLEQSRLVKIQQGDATRVLDYRRHARLDLLTQLMRKPDGRIDLHVSRSFLELREAITPSIARLAALRRSAEHVTRLEALVDETAPGRPAAMRLHDSFDDWTGRFWGLLVEASDNVAYQLISNTMREMHLEHSATLQPVIDAEYRNANRYREIAQHVIGGSAAAAEAAARSCAQSIARAVLDLAPRAASEVPSAAHRAGEAKPTSNPSGT